MQVVRIKGIKETERCIKFLKDHSCCNLYLYEGIKQRSSHHNNYVFREKEKPLAVLHTKSGRSVHVFLPEGSPDPVLKRVSKFIMRRFGGLGNVFGDSSCILRLIKEGDLRYNSVREYLYLEIEKEYFKAIVFYTGRPPPIEEASSLYPLQYQYEIEEMGVRESLLDKERMIEALRRRIQRGEITAIFDQGKAVAIAGVNARFENICQIGSVYVVPEYRGKGYGYSIVSSHIIRLFERYDRIALFVNARNQRARHIYERIGFVAAGDLMQISVW